MINLFYYCNLFFKLASLEVESQQEALDFLSINIEDLRGKSKQEKIKIVNKAYKNLSLTYHPDKPGGDATRFLKLNLCADYLKEKIETNKLELDSTPFTEPASVRRISWGDGEEIPDRTVHIKSPLPLWSMYEDTPKEEEKKTFTQEIKSILEENFAREKDPGEMITKSKFLDLISEIKNYIYQPESPLQIFKLLEKIPNHIMDQVCLEDLKYEVRSCQKDPDFTRLINKFKDLIVKFLFYVFNFT
jgi:hypothetical protein